MLLKARNALALMIATMVLLLGACSGDGVSSDKSSLATASASVSPSRTTDANSEDLSIIGSLKEAVETGNQGAMENLLNFFVRPCTGSNEIGAVPCGPGQPVGSPTRVIGVGGCEGSFRVEGDGSIGGAVSEFLAGGPQLYAVAQGDLFESGAVPSKYVMVFNAPGAQELNRSRALAVTSEGVTYLQFGCGHKPESFLGSNPLFVVPPTP